MSKSVYLLIFILILLCFQKVNGQNISNEGTEFWAVFPTHDPSMTPGNENLPRLANITIFVTSKLDSKVTVSCRGFVRTQDIPANTSVPFDVPRDSAYIPDVDAFPLRTEVIPNRGIHIQVAEGMPKVAAYAHIYAGARSAASLLLPVEAVGKKYYSMNYTQDADGKNYFILVATQPNTDVNIHKSGENVRKISLVNAGDIFEYIAASNEDLTGVFVEVDSVTSPCNKFAMFSGSTSDVIGDCIPGPRNTISRDPLFQQLYPVNSWGKNYGIVPFIDRRYILRVLAQEDNTVVKLDGTFVANLNEGQYYTLPVSSAAAFLSADKNISVAQYSLTQLCSGVNGESALGDPEMVLLNPIEFNIKQITLFSSEKEDIDHKYINICMKTSGTSSFKIDDAVPDKVWMPIPAQPDYSYLQIEVFQKSIKLTADVGFNAIAYGFGDYESYAYSAGTNLSSNNYLLVTNSVTNTDSPDACIQEVSDFKIVLPYTLSKITWKLDMEVDSVDNSPVADTINVNGDVLYSYLYKKNKLFLDTGTHKMHVLAELALSTAGCVTGTTEYNFTFHVDALPTPIFEVDSVVCADTPIAFKDKSTANTLGKSITTWRWDFGDDTPLSTLQNPNHIFSSGGKYAVKLVVGTESGCKSDVRIDTILVRPKMSADFVINHDVCVKQNLLIKDQSTIEATGKIAKWYWDFGDGTDTVRMDSLPFYHKYTTVGKHTIVLVTESMVGACKSLPDSSIVMVNSLPKPDFKLPKACLDDVFAEFVNTSKAADGTTVGLSYLWNFGDDFNTAQSNTSMDTTGKHKYAAAGPYTVTLKTYSSFGCVDSVTKNIVISSSNPVAKFHVINKNQLCSKNKVEVLDGSYVSIGEITKLVWYPDLYNYPDSVVIDEDFKSPVKREFDYGLFNTQSSKQFTIKLLAYSGGTCMGMHLDTITVLAAPILKFDDIDPICVNAESIPLTQAAETANLPGTGVYSGPGVVQVGANAFKFNPAVAGVNESGHTITYTFTANNGCPETIVNKIKVMPKPSLFVDRDVYVLAGGQKMILAEATGFKISYQWSPVTGLSSSTISNPIVTPEKDTEYTVTVTSGSNCIVYQTVSVHVLNSVNAPNTFSPNGDGVNDIWNIAHLDSYPNVTVDIFDRYGAKVFFSKGYSVPFDGNFKNEALPVGTYYYIIDPKNGRSRITGSLTLIR